MSSLRSRITRLFRSLNHPAGSHREADRGWFEAFEPRQLMSVNLQPWFSYDAIPSGYTTVPGRRETIDVVISNEGDSKFKGSIGLNLYAVHEGERYLKDNAVLLGRYTRSGTIPAHDGAELPFSLTVPKGIAPGRYKVVAVIDPQDKIDESDETDNVAYSDTAVTVLGTPTRPTVSIKASKPKASETDPAGKGLGRFTFTRKGGDITRPLTVTYTLDPASTATPGDDFTPFSGTLTFAPGQRVVTLDLVPKDDTTSETTESVRLVISAGASYDIGTGAAQVNIADNEPSLTIKRKNDGHETDGQNKGRAVFVISRKGGDLSKPATVLYRIGADSTATQGADFDPLPSQLVIPAGSKSVTLSVPIHDDAIAEETEKLTLELLPGEYGVGSGAEKATARIFDNESTVSITANGRLSETKGAASFTIKRAGGSLDKDLVVKLSVSGSATSGDDYVPLPASVTIPKGKTSVTLPVISKVDTTPEGPESVAVAILLDNMGSYRSDTKHGRYVARINITDIAAASFLKLLGRPASWPHGVTGIPFNEWWNYDFKITSGGDSLTSTAWGDVQDLSNNNYRWFIETKDVEDNGTPIEIQDVGFTFVRTADGIYLTSMNTDLGPLADRLDISGLRIAPPMLAEGVTYRDDGTIAMNLPAGAGHLSGTISSSMKLGKSKLINTPVGSFDALPIDWSLDVTLTGTIRVEGENGPRDINVTIKESDTLRLFANPDGGVVALETTAKVSASPSELGTPVPIKTVFSLTSIEFVW